MEKPKYVPINCDYYDVLTVYAMHNNLLEIRFKHDLTDESLLINGSIKDIFTEDKVEYLKTEQDVIIRLDHLLNVKVLK